MDNGGREGGTVVIETPFNVGRREDLEPVCPHCERKLAEIYYKSKGPGWFVFPSTAVDFCPGCLKVLGFGQSRMA